MDNVKRVVFTKTELSKGVVIVRLAALESDAETGAMCVCDILETYADNEAGIRWFAKKVETDYPAAEVFFAHDRTVESFDTGRARKMASKIVRAIDQLEVESY